MEHKEAEPISKNFKIVSLDEQGRLIFEEENVDAILAWNFSKKRVSNKAYTSILSIIGLPRSESTALTNLLIQWYFLKDEKKWKEWLANKETKLSGFANAEQMDNGIYLWSESFCEKTKNGTEYISWIAYPVFKNPNMIEFVEETILKVLVLLCSFILEIGEDDIKGREQFKYLRTFAYFDNGPFRVITPRSICNRILFIAKSKSHEGTPSILDDKGEIADFFSKCNPLAFRSFSQIEYHRLITCESVGALDKKHGLPLFEKQKVLETIISNVIDSIQPLKHFHKTDLVPCYTFLKYFKQHIRRCVEIVNSRNQSEIPKGTVLCNANTSQGTTISSSLSQEKHTTNPGSFLREIRDHLTLASRDKINREKLRFYSYQLWNQLSPYFRQEIWLSEERFRAVLKEEHTRLISIAQDDVKLQEKINNKYTEIFHVAWTHNVQIYSTEMHLANMCIEEITLVYKNQMRNLLADGFYSAKVLNELDQALQEKLIGALLISLKYEGENENPVAAQLIRRIALEKLSNELQKFSGNNHEKIIEQYAIVKGVAKKARTLYVKEIEDIISKNPNGIETSLLEKMHETITSDVEDWLAGEMMQKVSYNEPLDAHIKSVHNYAEKYWKYVLSENEKNIGKEAGEKPLATEIIPSLEDDSNEMARLKESVMQKHDEIKKALAEGGLLKSETEYLETLEEVKHFAKHLHVTKSQLEEQHKLVKELHELVFREVDIVTKL